MTAPAIPNLVAGTWEIDPVHSDVSFNVRHMMVSKVRGSFRTFSGAITITDDPGTASAEATIDLASIETNNEQRDGHIKSADFFEVEKYPTMTFRSTGVRADGGDYVVTGDLTLKGVTKSVDLNVEVGGAGPDAFGGTRAGFTANTTINRSDFGVDISMPMDGGGVVVGEKVSVQLEIEAVLKTDAA